MRKFLSLVLALVMMMSLVTINAGAKEFTDGDDITYQEAVDVISTIKVVDGYENGSFNPGGNLTRGAAAKIICNLILGPTTAAELHADTAPFRDVPVNHDFAGYIAYCQKEGIISGYADGSFRPAGTLTGYAFMKMLLGALGYDAEIEGYVGPNWSINVAKKAISIGLNNSLTEDFNGVKFITREEAALYAFNTLQADMVEYDTKITATVNGAEVTVGNSTAASRKWNSQQTRYNTIIDDNIVQFAEEYFNKLVLTKDMDVFGRPDREWKYDGAAIGEYINTDLLKQEYTTKVTGRDLYDLLGSRVVDEYTFDIHIDGEKEKVNLDKGSGAPYFTQKNLIRSNTEKVGETGNGVLTQVFVDNDRDVEHVWIAVINTYLAKAVDDYNDKKEEVDFDVWSVDNVGSTSNIILVKKVPGTAAAKQSEVLTVKNEDINVEEVKEDDIVLVHVADGEIQEILDPETVDDTSISAFKKGSWVEADGTKYDYAHTVQYDTEVLDIYDDKNMKDTTYRVFLDEYGYAIGVEIVEEADKYVFLTGIDSSTSNLSNKTADGNVIHLDGTMETVKIDMDKSRNAQNEKFTRVAQPDTTTHTFVSSLMNTWCTYSVSANGTYTLTEVANDNATFTTKPGATLNTTAAYGASGRQNDKVGQGRNTAETTLDKAHVTLNGIDTSGFKRVYANDDTVFISAEVDLIQATRTLATGATGDKDAAIIISGVDAVSTGIQNVNITSMTAAQVKASDATKFASTTGDATDTAHGVYTLFKDNGYVIATVIVGEDDGTTTNYAYVTSSDMNREGYSKEDDEYTWSREAIVNGELVTLTEKGTTDPVLEGMTRNNWYEVKYKADGTVRKVQLIDKHDMPNGGAACTDDGVKHGQANGTADNAKDYIFCKNHNLHIGTGNAWPKYVGLIEYVEPSYDDGNDTIVLFEDLTSTEYELSVKGRTLQVDTTTANVSRGFAMSSDAKTVLVQDVQLKDSDGKNVGSPKLMDDIFEYTGGTDGAEKAIQHLNNNKKFRGYIGAVIENGVATSIVIYDKTNTDVNIGGGSGQTDQSQLGISEDGSGNLTYRYYAPTFAPADWDQIRTAAANAAAAYLNANILRNNLPTAKAAATGGNHAGTGGEIWLDDGSLRGESVQLSVQRMVKVFVDDVETGYVDARAYAPNFGAAGWGGTGTTALTGNILRDEYAGSPITLATEAMTATDGNVYLYHTYTLTLPADVTGAYTDLDNTTGTLAASTAHNVKRDLSVNLTLTNKSDGQTYQMSDLDGAFGNTAALTATSQTLVNNGYIVSKNQTITVGSGYVIQVDGARIGLAADGDDIDFTTIDVPGVLFVNSEATKVAGSDHWLIGDALAGSVVAEGFGKYTYTVDQAHDVNGDGVINLIPVVNVEMEATAKATYSFGSTPTTVTIAASTDNLVKVGTALTVTEQTAADGHKIKVDVDDAGAAADADGTTTTADTGNPGAVVATATFNVGNTNLGHKYTFSAA